MEIKLLSIGEPSLRSPAEWATVRTQQIPYFVRLADAATVSTQALGEVHRRGSTRRARWPPCRILRDG